MARNELREDLSWIEPGILVEQPRVYRPGRAYPGAVQFSVNV